MHLARAGGCAILLPGERRPVEIGHDLAGWAAVHARLALVERGPAPAGAALGPRGGAVIWVTRRRPRRAPRALERLPAGARIVVSPTARPGVRVAVRGRRLHRLPGRARAARGGRVSASAAGPSRRRRGARCRAAPSARPPPPCALRAPLLRLAAFAALALFAAAHWVTLVDSPPVGRTLLVVLVATGTARC